MDEASFRAAYERDAANKGRQSWDEYRKWVAAFYEGKRFPPVAGWTSREKELAARLKPEARTKVLGRLAEVGKLMASEWAKDNTVRKVGTDDLQRHGKDLERAAQEDAGDGARILAAAEGIEAELRKRVG